jgi:nicotinamidase/pyrazinamidase
MQALVLVDIQYDFLPGGALAVPDGDAVVPVAERLIETRCAGCVLATQDWHPPDHGSFASQHSGKAPFEVGELDGMEQVLWPDHCVQYTHGASLARALPLHRIERVFYKGTDPRVDSYSAFFDNARRRSTGLAEYLRLRGVSRLVMLGLATDYCVKASVLDAMSQGFDTTVVLDGMRAVGLDPRDEEQAIQEMRAAGARIRMSHELG